MVRGQSASCIHALALVYISLAGEISCLELFYLRSRNYPSVKPENGSGVWFQSMVPEYGSRSSLVQDCCEDAAFLINVFPVSYFCKHFPILRTKQVCEGVTSFCGAQGSFVTVLGQVRQPLVSMGYVLGPMHLAILSPSPSAFAIHSAFPGEFGFDQAGAGATYLGRTEKQMSTRGCCSQMCMPQRSADVGKSRHRIASGALLPPQGLACPLSLCMEFPLQCGCK